MSRQSVSMSGLVFLCFCYLSVVVYKYVFRWSSDYKRQCVSSLWYGANSSLAGFVCACVCHFASIDHKQAHSQRATQAIHKTKIKHTKHLPLLIHTFTWRHSPTQSHTHTHTHTCTRTRTYTHLGPKLESFIVTENNFQGARVLGARSGPSVS